MALTDLLNPDDPYRKSLESALYGRQSDVINTQADRAQTDARENAFGRGVGFSSILPDYSTAPIERERLRALTSAAQNAFLGAGQEARSNAQVTNQANQFAQSQGQQESQYSRTQAQQAAQFQQMMRQQQQALAERANQNLISNIAGGAGGLATLLLRPQGAGTSTLGGNIVDWLGKRGGQGVDYLSSVWGGDRPTGLDLNTGGGGGFNFGLSDADTIGDALSGFGGLDFGSLGGLGNDVFGGLSGLSDLDLSGLSDAEIAGLAELLSGLGL